MQKIGAALMRLLEVLVVILISIMSILVIVNVGLRFLFDSSIVVSEELSRFLFIWVVFLGAIIAMKEDAHIYVDFIRKAMPRPVQWCVILIVEFAMLYCCYFLFMGSVELTQYNSVDKAPVSGISMGYVYIAGAVGAFGMGVVLIVRIVKHIINLHSFLHPTDAQPQA